MSIRRILQLCVLLVIALLLFNCSDGSGGGTVETTKPPEPGEPLSLISPARMASLPTGDLVVSDYIEQKFCLVDQSNLDVTTCYPAKGRPTGVVYADYGGGSFYVGNESVGSVDIFDINGTFLGHLGGQPNIFGQVNDLAIDEDNQRIFVLDSKDKNVRIFNFNGSEIGVAFDSSDLKQPIAITFDNSTGYVLVSDFGDLGDPSTTSDDIPPQIRIFDANLDPIVQIDAIKAVIRSGSLGSSISTSVLQGLSVFNGYVFVADSLSGEIQIYNLATKVAETPIGGLGTETGKLFYPLDVYVDPTSKDIFVADNRNSRVSVFRGAGEVGP